MSTSSEVLNNSSTAAALIHPFDDPQIWNGHASLITEVAAEREAPDAVIVSVGGGGLLLGVLHGLHSVGWGHVPVVAVETEGAASLSKSLQIGRPVCLDAITSVATSLGACQVADKAFERAAAWPVRPHVVSDQEAVQGVLDFARDHRVLVEPACGAALAALNAPEVLPTQGGPVLVIVCGGAGATLETLDGWCSTVGLPRSP